MKPSTIKTGLLQRSFDLNKDQINQESRSISLSFSSETPVERYFGVETLDHSATSVRLARLRNKGPLLMDHNTSDQIGVVEDVQITSDQMGRAVVRFSKSERAQEIWQDVVDGIRGNISVGYQIHKMVLEEERDGKEFLRATDWEPMEISIVSVPADTAVGIGRSAIEVDTIIERRAAQPAPATPIIKEKPMEAKPVVDVVDAKTILAGEQRRVADLLAMGKRHNRGEESEQFIREGKSADDFGRHILASLKPETLTADNPNQLDLSAREVQSYSLLRAINASVTGDWSKAGFERECSMNISAKLGRDARGFFVPLNVQQRTLTAGTANTGAQMVGTDHLAGSFIDALIAESVMGKLGATYLPGLVGDVDIPAMGAATFYWLTEDQDVTDSTPASRSVALSPKTIGGSVPMSRRFIKQSSPAAEMVIERLLRRGAAAAIDTGVIQGTGLAGQPLGIVGASGVNTETITIAGQPSWADIVAFETAVATDEALSGRLAYLMSHGVKGWCKTTVKDAGAGQFIWGNNEVNGYAAMASNLVPANGIIFGNFEDVYVGLWGTLDINPDTSTKAASGGLVLRVFQDVDCGVGNAVSFCVNA